MVIYKKIKTMLEEKINKIVEKLKKLNPEKIILFGSFAYGRPDKNSDLDLLIIMDSQKKSAERIREVSRLLRPRIFPMDVIVKTPEEIEKRIKLGDPFIIHILKEGKVLYERNS